MTKASKEPLISVIVPIYKVEEYLDKCIESIVNQTYKSLEIILVDDGSPDDCPEKCDEWAKRDNRIVVVHKENGGVCSARNMGLDKAKGEWISFVDADDYVEPTYIEDMYKKAIETNAKYICCGYNKVYGNNKESINNDNTIKEIEWKDFIISLLNVQNGYGFVHMKLIKKDILEENRFDESLLVGEDALFNVQIAKELDKAVIYNKALYNYKINLNSVVRKYDVNYVKKYTKSMEVMKKYINGNYQGDKVVELNLSNYIAYHLLLICVNYCYNPHNTKKYKSLKKTCNMEIYKEAIKKSDYKSLSLSRKITLFTLKHKFYWLTAMICNIRQKQLKK